MKTIGIRELRQRASQYLRHVEEGQAFEITARGRLVALLVPARGVTPVERLALQGRVRRPSRDLLDLGPPLAPAPGKTLPSTMLRRSRAAER